MQVVAKENQLIEMKNDIKELSEIIAKMTDVYKELEVKYVKLTEDHDETQKKLYEANIKAVYADKLESEFEGIIRNLNKSKKQTVDFSKRINVIQTTVIDLRNDLLEYDEYSNNINQNLSSEDNS